MVEKVVVFQVGDRTFSSQEEAAKYESTLTLRGLVADGPFMSETQGLNWLNENAAAIVAALRPSVRRPRRSSEEIAAEKAAKAEAKAARAAAKQQPQALAA